MTITTSLNYAKNQSELVQTLVTGAGQALENASEKVTTDFGLTSARKHEKGDANCSQHFCAT